MNETEKSGTRGLALAAGAVALASAVSLAVYLVAGGPFGTLNDIGNGAIGFLGAALAWRLRDHLPTRLARVALGCAIAGAAISAIGSALVISGTTGYFLAGLVSSFGYAGIGAWLIILNRSTQSPAWPRQLRGLGVAAGALLALGLGAAPGILLRLDDPATAPGWAWFAMTAWVGVYVAFPAWTMWLARVSRADPIPHRIPGAVAGS